MAGVQLYEHIEDAANKTHDPQRLELSRPSRWILYSTFYTARRDESILHC